MCLCIIGSRVATLPIIHSRSASDGDRHGPGSRVVCWLNLVVPGGPGILHLSVSESESKS